MWNFIVNNWLVISGSLVLIGGLIKWTVKQIKKKNDVDKQQVNGGNSGIIYQGSYAKIQQTASGTAVQTENIEQLIVHSCQPVINGGSNIPSNIEEIFLSLQNKPRKFQEDDEYFNDLNKWDLIKQHTAHYYILNEKGEKFLKRVIEKNRIKEICIKAALKNPATIIRISEEYFLGSKQLRDTVCIDTFSPDTQEIIDNDFKAFLDMENPNVYRLTPYFYLEHKDILNQRYNESKK